MGGDRVGNGEFGQQCHSPHFDIILTVPLDVTISIEWRSHGEWCFYVAMALSPHFELCILLSNALNCLFVA